MKKIKNMEIMGIQYQGPIPPPTILEQFDKVYPGAAKIILDNFVDESKHRRWASKISGVLTLIGVCFAFILGMTTIIGAIICILNGKDVSGLTLGGAGLTSLVGAFIYGTKKK